MSLMHETRLLSTHGQLGHVSKNDDEELCFLKYFDFIIKDTNFFFKFLTFQECILLFIFNQRSFTISKAIKKGYNLINCEKNTFMGFKKRLWIKQQQEACLVVYEPNSKLAALISTKQFSGLKLCF